MGKSLESYHSAIGRFSNYHPPTSKHISVVGERKRKVKSDSPHQLFSIHTIVILLLIISGID